MEIFLILIGLLAMVEIAPTWFEFVKATGYLGLVFYLIVVDRPRQDSRQDEQAAAHRVEVVAIIKKLADDIRDECRNDTSG